MVETINIELRLQGPQEVIVATHSPLITLRSWNRGEPLRTCTLPGTGGQEASSQSRQRRKHFLGTWVRRSNCLPHILWGICQCEVFKQLGCLPWRSRLLTEAPVASLNQPFSPCPYLALSQLSVAPLASWPEWSSYWDQVWIPIQIKSASFLFQGSALVQAYTV